MAKVVIIGAGICGLGGALLLARDGHDVTVLERDGTPIPDSPQQAWDVWARKGIAQFRQPHNFMPGLRAILEAELPDVQESLRRAGAGRLNLINPLPPSFTDRAPRPIDDRLWTWTARRPTGEWVFADAARREPRITMRRGVGAVGLLTGPSTGDGIPHVTGVRTATGEPIAAELVVDAMGRSSNSPRWLASIGARPPLEEQDECGFTYYTRYFRGSQPERRAPGLMPLGTISMLTLPGDNGTWSVTIFCASGDEALAGLRQADRWTRVVQACPLHAHWLEGEPITDVLAMSGIVDRYRRFVVDGAPVVTGFVPLADAWACTNPSAGRGLTVGFIHATRLRDVVREAGDGPRALADRFDEVTERDVTPWYRAQVAMDRWRFAEIEALREGREPPPPVDDLTRQCLSLFATMAADPDLFRAGLEYIGTLAPVQEIVRRSDVAERIAEVMKARRGGASPPMPGPTREQLVGLAS